MKKKIYLAAAALMIVATLGIGSAMAYFTTYVLADGGVKVSMGSTVTVPDEIVEENTKLVTIKNEGDFDCWVRVKVFTGAENGGYTFVGSDNWNPAQDGYIYYKEIVPVDGSTDVLKLFINKLVEENDIENESFNVIVIQECTPVLYDENGEAYADWSVNAEVLNKEVE